MYKYKLKHFKNASLYIDKISKTLVIQPLDYYPTYQSLIVKDITHGYIGNMSNTSFKHYYRKMTKLEKALLL